MTILGKLEDPPVLPLEPLCAEAAVYGEGKPHERAFFSIWHAGTLCGFLFAAWVVVTFAGLWLPELDGPLAVAHAMLPLVGVAMVLLGPRVFTLEPTTNGFDNKVHYDARQGRWEVGQRVSVTMPWFFLLYIGTSPYPRFAHVSGSIEQFVEPALFIACGLFAAMMGTLILTEPRPWLERMGRKLIYLAFVCLAYGYTAPKEWNVVFRPVSADGVLDCHRTAEFQGRRWGVAGWADTQGRSARGTAGR